MPGSNPRSDAVRRTYLRKRDYVFRFKEERGCADCSERDPIVLQLDHLDPEKKTRNGPTTQGRGPARATRWFNLSWMRLFEELEKCEVVCANCHARRTAKAYGWYATKVEDYPSSRPDYPVRDQNVVSS